MWLIAHRVICVFDDICWAFWSVANFTSVLLAARGEVKPHLDIIWLMSCLSDLTAKAISTEMSTPKDEIFSLAVSWTALLKAKSLNLYKAEACV